MTEQEVLDSLRRYILSDLPVSKIVNIYLSRLRDQIHPDSLKAWTKAVFFIKQSSWEAFCEKVLITPDNPSVKIRYEAFREELVLEIVAYWENFVRGLN